MSPSPVDRGLCAYAACYCEENVWRLLDSGRLEPGAASALFISNRDRRCPLWRQRTATQPDAPVVWDYHVVALLEAEVPLVWDLDSTLPFPCAAGAYLSGTFPRAGALGPELEPQFRLVDAATFLRTFSSDRSHMRQPDGGWLAPPPPWPPIRASGEATDLMGFVDMGAGGPGERFDLPGLRGRLRVR